jgi:NOL1/NOP2/fmu family ribosome biogenesis protein
MAETYHYHETYTWHSAECFDLTRSEVNDSLEWESDEFRAWILGNPSVGDTYIGGGNDVALVQRI